MVILVGDQDDVVGTSGADTFWEWLRPLPASLRTYRVIRTRADLLANHEAPTVVTSPVVRKVFWTPLDRLVSDAHQAP